jgi:hypothetical protein
MTLSVEIDTLDDMAGLDFKSPFDELSELRTLLTTQQIADFTGLRRETISRARPDSNFRRRTEKALGDLYLVVTRMRAAAGGDLGQLAAVLRRPQAALGGRSIADLLREGKVDVVLEHLAEPEPPARSTEPPVRGAPPSRRDEAREEAVETFLAGDPEMAALLPEIEAKVREHFAPVRWIERGVIVEYEGEGDDVLYVWAHNDLSFDENVERLTDFLEQERDFLRPVRSRLNIGAVR